MRIVRGVSACLSLASIALIGLGPGCGSNIQGSDFDDAGGTNPAGGAVDGGSGSASPDDPFGNGGGLGSYDGSAPVERLDGGCATAEAAANLAPVYMLIVLDGSGSMTYGTDKWGAAQNALNRFFQDAHDKNDTTIGVGLVLFSGELGSNTSDYPKAADAPDTRMVDAARLARLRRRINVSNPGGTTPTGAALRALYPLMQRFKTEASGPSDTNFARDWAASYAPLQPNGKKVVVLASDGKPTGNNDETTVPNLAGDNLRDHKILTFSIGIGPFPGDTNYDPAFMGRVAVAGGTAPAGCDPASRDLTKACHFQITPGGDANQVANSLLAAINRIRKVAAGCEYVLGSTNGTIDPTRVNVVVRDANGTEVLVSKDPRDGWTYDNEQAPTRVILNGTTCERVKADEKVQIRIVLGCKTGVN